MCIPESEWPFKSFNGPYSAPEGIFLNIKKSWETGKEKCQTPTKTDGKKLPQP